MTELDEVGGQIWRTDEMTVDVAREIALALMPDELVTVIDGVVRALMCADDGESWA